MAPINSESEEFAKYIMSYALAAAEKRKLTSEQYAEAFCELSRAADAEYQECLER